MSARHLTAMTALLLSLAGQKPDLFAHRTGLWSLAPQGDTLRWIEIHNLDEAGRSGVFHVEVLARRRGDPAWKVKHVAPHVAITTAALERSVVAPLTRGAVYPETFDAAYRKWQEARSAGGRAPVCDSTIDECLRAATPEHGVGRFPS
jgi:uncharacterized protein DUF5086